MKKRTAINNIFIVPNYITFAGMVGVFVYVWEYLSGRNELLFLTIFLVGLSDFLDGYLARKLNQVTRFGAIMDIARDRLLLLSFFGNIVYYYGLNILSGAVGYIIFCEIVFNVLRVGLLRCGFIDSIRRHHVGKSRQVAHLLCMGVITISFNGSLPFEIFSNYSNWLFSLCLKTMFFFTFFNLCYFVSSIVHQYFNPAH